MPHFRIVLAYDGTDFVGWQRQASGVSVQGLIQDALRSLDGRDVTVTGAGRTDAGVHALGQVAAFTIARELGADALVRALNAHLPHAVRVLTAEDVPATFHPRFGARTKTYRYRLWNGDVMSPFERRYAWHVPGPLDVEAMCAAATLFEGRHDFAAFQATGSSVATTEREILVSTISTTGDTEDTEGNTSSGRGLNLRVPRVLRGGELRGGELRGGEVIVYEVTGNGFLRHMVRIIVGSLVEIGRGRQPVEWITGAIASRTRATAGPTAPPDGLFLMRVDYADSLAAGS
jgi:tRNA pseudouridine38-40 synthase